MNCSTSPWRSRMAAAISVKYSLRSRTTSRGAVASTQGVKSRMSAKSTVTSLSSPSPWSRPARISSRISGVTYRPNVSLTKSRSRRPASIRLKPSARRPISSLETTGARASRSPCSTRASIATEPRLAPGSTRKITAATVTIPLTKKYTKIETAVPVSRGSTTRASVRAAPAPRLTAASSTAGSTCPSVLLAASTAAGNFENTTEATRIHVVPVRSSGGTPKART